MTRRLHMFTRKFAVLLILALGLAITSGPVLAAPGDLKWSGTGFSPSNSPAIDQQGILYVGGQWPSTKLYAVNPLTGAVNWEFEMGAGVSGDITVGTDGTIYACTGTYLTTGKVFAINPNNTQKWVFEGAADFCYGIALAADGTLYVGSGDKKVYALNPVDGTKKWERSVAGTVFHPVVSGDGTVYVGSADYDGMFYALDPANGNVKHSYKTRESDSGDSSIYACPAIGADGTVYVGNYNKKFFAFNPNLTVKWKYTTVAYARFLSSPAIGADGTIYVGTRDSYKFYAFDPATHLPKWELTFPGNDVSSSPLVGSDGIIYVGVGGTLYALHPADGATYWHYDAAGQGFVDAPNLGQNGTIYAKGFNQYGSTLYALYSSSTALASSTWPMFAHDRHHRSRSSGAAPPVRNVAPVNSLLLGQ